LKTASDLREEAGRARHLAAGRTDRKTALVLEEYARDLDGRAQRMDEIMNVPSIKK